MELDLPCTTRKVGVGLPICNLPCSVLDRLKSKLTISFQKYFLIFENIEPISVIPVLIMQ